MCSNNSDFIIRACRDKKTGENKNVLRRYKGGDSVVVIPDSVNMISDNIFADDIESNDFVEKIIIPDSVTEISSNAFAWCMALKEIVFPKTLREFNVNFDSCPSIKEISIPESVKKIGCFHCGKNLKRIRVGENICELSVQNSSKNKKSTALTPMQIADVLLSNPVYSIDAGFLVNKKHRTTLFRLSLENTDVRIPDGIRTIGTNTFYESYQHLKSVPEM
ncbi:MAG: leucine-rich repeat domain-containing protein, partial [Treponema sp.]|nr:leucine-rich repeat domain-containing protein [Treponema sp.]